MTHDADVMAAEAGLKWAAEGEFSASITPAQARALRKELAGLRAIRDLYAQTLQTQTTARPTPVPPSPEHERRGWW